MTMQNTPMNFVQTEAPKKMAAHAYTAPSSSEPPGKAKPIAVFVCHGMGEQVPFESIDDVSRIVRKHIQETDPSPAGQAALVSTRVVEAGALQMARAELHYTDADGGAREIHIYESYWAPLTAGKVSIKEVFRFLLAAGFGGMDRSFQLFNRYMFNALQYLDAPGYRRVFLFVLLLTVLASLGFMSAIVVSVGAARTLTRGMSNWPSASLVTDLSCDLGVYGAVALALALAYALAWYLQRANKQEATDRSGSVLNKLILGLLALCVVATIGTAALMAYHLLVHQASNTFIGWHGRVADFLSDEKSLSSSLLVIAIWALVLLLNDKTRAFFVTYLGDVLAYISPHKASKFYDTRQAIQQSAKDAASAVYGLNQNGGRAYDQIIVMGHSLGSVIVYDALNALLLDDILGAGLDVRGRTSHLITFGSPLDKTAFIFREQQHASLVREALSATMQPLILDYANRARLRWVNLWSIRDPISGSLEYYDAEPKNRPAGVKSVENYHDSYANIPLFAHTMYWQSPALRAALGAAIDGKDCKRAILESGFATSTAS
ncbi:MAG TPA: hypothetical protein DCW29_07695 [Janthinobacterium sp.]|nr:hypothetical protein [Janthinobacterium sp.]